MDKKINVDSESPGKVIRLSKSCIGEAEKCAVMRVLDREFFGMGDEVKKFEDALSVFFGRPTVCVVNGTAALHLALQSCGINRGDEVLVPALTYVASFQAISATGAKPVACDVNIKNLTLDWKDAEKRVTANTKAIMPVHYAGGIGALDEIYTFAEKHALRVIEDAAHAFGTTYQGKRVGSFGDIACFSFDGIKNITSGEGGCIVTEDEAILEHVSDARLLGVKNDTIKRYANQRSWDFDVTDQGWRYHMSDIMAAIGIVQLNRFSELSLKREKIAIMYDLLFVNSKYIFPLLHNYDEVVPHIYVVRVKGLQNRVEFQKLLLKEGIQIGYHYQPNHWLSIYKDKSSSLPVTESIFPELISLPLHPDISSEDVEYIVTSFKKILKRFI